MSRAVNRDHIKKVIKEAVSFRQAIINRAKEGLCVCHEIPDHPYVRFTEWNPRMKKITGYTMDQINRKGWYQTVYPDPAYREKARRRMQRMRRGDDLIGEKWEITRSDGKKRIMEISTSLLHTADGFSHVLAVMNDVTEQENSARELKENEKFLRSVFESLQDGLSILGRDLNIIRTNKWMEKKYQDTLPLIGKKCYRAYQGRKSACPWCPSVKTLKDGNPHVNTVPYFAEGRRKGWILLSAYPFKDERGRVVGVIEHVRDITDQKEAEEELKESERKFRELYEGLKDGSAAVDMQGRITSWNRSFQNMLGYSAGEIPRLTYGDITPEKWHPIEEKILEGQVKKRGYSDPYEKEYIKKDGTIFPVELTTYLTRNREGRPVGMWAFIRDITEKKRIDRMKEDLLRNVSHELKTPIAMIEMACGMYERGMRAKDPGRMEKAHGIASENAARLKVDVENILHLFALSSGRERKKKSVSLGRIISDGVLPGLWTSINDKNLSVKLEIPRGKDTIKGDPGEIETLLRNIVNNAVKFTDKGGISIKLAARGKDAEIKIKDSGCGIPPEDLEKVFEKFYQRNPAIHGTGLGLTICKEIAERCNGKIDVFSAGLGKGTTVTVVLPRNIK